MENASPSSAGGASPAARRPAGGRPTPKQIFAAFFRIGLTSFGGGLVAYLRDAVVDQKKWMDDGEFLAALEIGQTLPGLNSVNVSIIVGRKLAGARGSVAAATGLVLPGAFLLAALGVLYIRFQHNPDVRAALAGVTAAAAGLLLQVTLKIGAKQFLNPKDLLFVIPTFVLVGIFHMSLLAALFLLAPVAVWVNRPPGFRARKPGHPAKP